MSTYNNSNNGTNNCNDEEEIIIDPTTAAEGRTTTSSENYDRKEDNYNQKRNMFKTTKYTWEELIDIIRIQKDLSLLRRSYEQEEFYQSYREQIKSEWISIHDFILHTKFQFPKTEKKIVTITKSEEEMKKKKKKRLVIAGMPPCPPEGYQWTTITTTTKVVAVEEDQKEQKSGFKRIIARNDFPYYFPNHIEHWCVWKLAIGGEGEKDDNGVITREDIEWAKKELRKQKTSNNSVIVDTLDWINPPHLKSLPSIDHAHIICLLEDE